MEFGARELTPCAMPRGGLRGQLRPLLGEVFSVCQRGETGIRVHAMQATGAWLQEQSKGHEKLLHESSKYATAAVTPGAAVRMVSPSRPLFHRASMRHVPGPCRCQRGGDLGGAAAASNGITWIVMLPDE